MDITELGYREREKSLNSLFDPGQVIGAGDQDDFWTELMIFPVYAGGN